MALSERERGELADMLRDAFHKVRKPFSVVVPPAPKPAALTVRPRETRQRVVVDQPLHDDAGWRGLEKRAASVPKRDVHVLLRTNKRKLKQTFEVFSVEHPTRESSPSKLDISYPKPKRSETSTATINAVIARIRGQARLEIHKAIAGYKPGPLRLSYVPRIRKSQPTVPALPRVIRL